MLTPQQKAVNVPKRMSQSSEEKRQEQERLRDVLILLEHLFEREEATVKMILDCLYDVGSVNLINKKFPSQPLNPLMKSIARVSKPAFKFWALRKVKRNAPQLITDWLHRKIRF
jgi:hypothetical protein